MDPSCVTFYAVWAPGADSFETPPEAGIALGGDSGVNWVVLQIHYTNTALTTDLVDNSGFQLNVSTTLRQYDMGFLTLGTLDISIPPGVANYSSTPNLCPRSCTQQMTRPVTMILAGFHMHPLGKSIRTQWFRNGQELPLLGERRAFDFNYQGAVYIDASRNVLMPGDELITTCTWDSRSRTNITRFGETTDDEMCFNFLLYYPRMPSIDMCITAPPALVGPRTVAFCTNISRVAMLNTLVRSQNTPAILGAYASMMKSGELVDASPRIYAPYSQACSPYNFTNSRGGIDSSSGEHVHNDDPSARMPSLPKASLITPPPRAQQSLPTAVPRPLPPLADYIKTPPSPTAVTKPPPLADYVKTPPVSYAKLPPQVKPPMPSPTAKTMPPIDFAKPPSIVQPPMPSPTAKTMPPIDFAKPPSIVQPPMPSPMAKTMPPIDFAKPPSIVQPPMPSPMAKTMPPIDFAKPPSIVQPPMPSPMAKTMPPIDFAKPPSIVQPPMPSPMAKTMPPIDFAKPPSIVQPPMPSPMAKTMPPIDFAKPPSIVQPPPQTAFPKPLSPPTSAVKPAPPPTAAAKPSPPPTAKPLSPSAAVKPPPAKPSPRPLGPKDVVSPPPPKPS
ncbi:hypothetical protein Vretifemale_3547 [Volvox reticuliferus]|nr:hypothetical protein Vretifemale_3547 [Volvox reticuliferus]